MTSSPPLLEIEDLHASAGDTEIIKGMNLTVERGEIHAFNAFVWRHNAKRSWRHTHSFLQRHLTRTP